MRKIVLAMLLFICASTNVPAQINYLYNPSFEQKWECPNGVDRVKFANYWTPITDTANIPADSVGDGICFPEYCNTCATSGFSSIPVSAAFHHNTRTGDGMMQVQMYANISDSGGLEYKRDYLQGRLKQSLQPGIQYCISFYVCLEGGSGFAINHIGAYFDDGTIDTTTLCGLPETTHIPQILETSIISDEVNWTKVQGVFTATGNEKFITIGNFFDAAHTDTISVVPTIPGSYVSWYLVDDISVIEIDSVANAGRDTTILAGDTAWIGNHDDYLPCKWYLAATGALIDSNHAGLAVHPSMTTSYVMELDVCGTVSYDTVMVYVHPTGITPALSLEEGGVTWVLLPNPARDEVMLKTTDKFTPTLKGGVVVWNMFGNVVYTGELISSASSIDISGLAAGVYVVEVNEGGRE